METVANRPLDVSVVPCDAYEHERCKAALQALVEPLGGLTFVKPGDRVVVKANLITFLKPDKAATTHPVLLSALTELLRERGASVVIGDSPGGRHTGRRFFTGLGPQNDFKKEPPLC